MNAKFLLNHVGDLLEGLVVALFDLFNYQGLNILEFGFASPAALDFKKTVNIASSDLVLESADAALAQASKLSDAGTADTGDYQY